MHACDLPPLLLSHPCWIWSSIPGSLALLSYGCCLFRWLTLIFPRITHCQPSGLWVCLFVCPEPSAQTTHPITMKLRIRTQGMPRQCILPGIRAPIFRCHGNREKLHFWATVANLAAIFSGGMAYFPKSRRTSSDNIISFRMSPFPDRYLKN